MKHGSSDYAGVSKLHDRPPSAPPLQVSLSVMTDQLEREVATSTPLKSELQRDLKIAQATNLKHSETIQCLKNDNNLQKVIILLCKTEVKAAKPMAYFEVDE